MATESLQSIDLFYCYAHQDQALRDELDKHLSTLRRTGLITAWYDREILPGAPWEQEIEQHLNTAHVIILLVSPDFMYSDYCYSKELQRAIERHHAKEARVIPVIVRPVDWTGAPFSQLQMLPSNVLPVTRWSDRDEAFEDVAKGIRRVVNDLYSLPLAVPDSPLPLPDEQQQREQTISHEELGQASLSATALSEVSPHPPPMQQMVQALAPQISQSPPETETQILTQLEEINDSAAHTSISEREHELNLSNFGGGTPMKGISRQKEQDVAPATKTNQRSRDVFVRWLCPQYEKELAQSLQGMTLMTLELYERFDVTRSHAQRVFRRTPHPEHQLPPGTTILQAYDEAGHGLLILGEPGAGKTTLLLDLAIHLLRRAIQDPTHQIPVILNLASWAEKQLPLTTWLVEELLLWYNVPRHLGQIWVQNGHLLPLLDGLDEMTEAVRLDCVEAINTYREQHSVPLVVCCRKQELLALAKRTQLALPTAITVQPLRQEQVNEYLEQAGKPMAAVRTILRTNLVLRDLITTPLMLNVVTLTYQDKATKDLPQMGSAADQQRKIFDNYVERMLQQRETKEYYTSKQIMCWLAGLAKQMQQHNQRVFYIERIQPDWLSRKWWQVYDLFAMKLPGVLLGILTSLIVLTAFPRMSSFTIRAGLLGGLFGWLLSREYAIVSSNTQKMGIGEWLKYHLITKRFLSANVFFALGVGLSVGLFMAASYGLHDGFIFGVCYGIAAFMLNILASNGVIGRGKRASPRRASTNFWIDTWFRIINTEYLRQGILVGLIAGGSEGLATGLQQGLISGPIVGLFRGFHTTTISSLFFGAVGIILGLILIRRKSTIDPVEKIDWSWHQLRESLFDRRHLKNTLLVMFFVGLFYGIAKAGWRVSLLEQILISLFLGFSGAVVWSWIYWALVGFFYGAPSKDFNEHDSISPNQGIRRSLYTSLRMGCISSSVSWFVCSLAIILFFGPVELLLGHELSLPFEWNQLWQGAMWQGLSYGLLVGLLVGMSNGGFACLQHYIIRVLLGLNRSTPWHYVHFLDSAARCILLRKVGGGYSFIHPLFLDYFALLGQHEPG